jgi:cell division protein FtsX
MDKKQLYQKIYIQYGYEAMLEKWIEELLELTTLLQQSKSKPISSTDLIKETSDVSIIVEQIAEINDIHSEVIEMREKILKELPDKLKLA